MKYITKTQAYLTKAEDEVMDVIERHYPVTIKSIAIALGLSESTIRRRLTALTHKRFIAKLNIKGRKLYRPKQEMVVFENE